MTDEMYYAFCWYKEEQWERLKEIAVDPESIEDSYAEWKKKADKAIIAFRNSGINVKKISVDTEALLLWANEHERPLDGDARAEYAAFRLKEREERQNSK